MSLAPTLSRLVPVARRASDHPPDCVQRPCPTLASLLPCASLRESLNRERPNPKLGWSAMSWVIQGFLGRGREYARGGRMRTRLGRLAEFAGGAVGAEVRNHNGPLW